MGKVRLRGQENGADAPDDEQPVPVQLRPLAIRGVVVEKSVLVDALKLYLGPQLEDIQVFEDGEQFFLKLRPATAG